jgi:hypothetical protein
MSPEAYAESIALQFNRYTAGNLPRLCRMAGRGA